MKKLGTIFLVVLLAMFISSCGTKQAVQRENPDFRNVKWGDSSEIVKQYEIETKLSETSVGLTGEVKIENLDALLIYNFDSNDELHTALYDISGIESSSVTQCISIYNSLKETLVEKYGEPEQDQIVKTVDQSLINTVGESKALECGYILYGANWETQKTNIRIMLGAPDSEMTLIIAYTDPNYDSNNSGL